MQCQSVWFTQVTHNFALSDSCRLHAILLCRVYRVSAVMNVAVVYGVHSDEWYTVCFAGLHAAVNVALFDLQGHMQ